MICAKTSLPKYKVWKLKEAEDSEILALSQRAKIDAFLARVLVSREVRSVEEYETFVQPDITQFHDPFLFQDMKKAVDRILIAVQHQEKVLIYGDYDADGVTSTAMLLMFLRERGLTVDYHIPDRQEHGYGLSIETFEQLKHKAYSLVITVDCGVSAFEEVNYLNEQGIDVIITDHHTCRDQLPDAFAIVATSRNDCDYPFKKLAGVGVVFKLIHALSITIGMKDLYLKYIDLATLGTVADVVSLTGENRAIVYAGLQYLKTSCNIGLKALIDTVDTGEQKNEITSWTFGFVLAPRINAAGRVSDARKAVEMLITEDPAFAHQIALELNEDNQHRKTTEQAITGGAIELVLATPRFKQDRVIVLAQADWHQGVIGIVASRLVDKFYKPVIIISLEDDVGKGSARSIEGFNIYEALSSCTEILEKFGGHAQAAGLTIRTVQIEQLRDRLNAYAEGLEDEIVFQPRLSLDAMLTPKEISFENIAALNRLEPFGCGNNEPVFWIRELEVSDVKLIGADAKHLKMNLQKDGQLYSAIAFGMGDRYFDIFHCDRIDVACYMQKNVWNGFSKIQLRILEIQFPVTKLARDAFYQSLDAVYPYFETPEQPETSVNGVQYDTIGGIEKMFHFDADKTRTAVLVNDIASLHEMMQWIDAHQIDCRVYAGNDLVWCQGAGCVQNEESLHLLVIINPIPGKLPQLRIQNFVLIGTWANAAYQKKVKASLQDSSVPVEDYANPSTSMEALFPDRQSLRFIYQHLKTTIGKGDTSTTVQTIAGQISKSYKTEINVFQLRRALEIFQEIKLLSLETQNNDTITIDLLPGGNTQGDLLEQSTIYTYLKSL
ncbi:MAG: single-stranded-DNA-specific exonuclease RecJ [Clostridia bacterium]